MAQFAVVGAGFSGAIISRELAISGHQVDVFETRNHVAGNCHTYRDSETGILVHGYGPHIFHTSNKFVWDFVRRFGEFNSFTNRVKAVTDRGMFSLPINLLTINQFFGKCLSPIQAERVLSSLGDQSIVDPKSFEEQALRFVGRELYENFFKGYTVKQWGTPPDRLPASILKRLPIRFNYDDNYFNDRYQGIPVEGYSSLIANILSVGSVAVHLETEWNHSRLQNYDHVFWSGPIDAWFDHKYGRLGYRTLRFERFIEKGDFQGNAVINYCSESVPYTRISEHKHFAPEEKHELTVCFREYSGLCGVDDIPYYPLRLQDDKTLLDCYIEAAKRSSGVTFIGRLGTYRYLDMNVIVEETLKTANEVIADLNEGKNIKPFYVDAI